MSTNVVHQQALKRDHFEEGVSMFRKTVFSFGIAVILGGTIAVLGLAANSAEGTLGQIGGTAVAIVGLVLLTRIFPKLKS